MPKESKINWQTLKHIITGGELSVEQKGEPAKNIESTVKLIYSCNELPNIRERADGIKRRIVIIPFLKQFLSKKDQNPKLLTKLYWNDELDLIFNWLIEGLQNLLKRGFFIEPESSIQIKKEHFLEQNPERQFLIDNLEHVSASSCKMPSGHLYLLYREHCKDHGETPVRSSELGKEVKRTFKGIEQTPNPIKLDDYPKKSRAWLGLRVKDLEQVEQESNHTPGPEDAADPSVPSISLSKSAEVICE